MKNIVIIIFLFAVASSYGQQESIETINEQITRLRKIIIPPTGTSKEKVDLVFGVPEEIKKLKGKGSKTHYPMHIYQLLPAKESQDFRVFLYVTYRNKKVYYMGINHICVIKNRTESLNCIKRQKDIEKENRRVLADLIEIKKKYESKLKNASWNKIKSEQQSDSSNSDSAIAKPE